MEVSDGVLNVRSREEVEAFFRSYFEGATYHEWRDAEPPVIRLSEDGTMAWVARRVEADREGPAGDGTTLRRQFVSAYTATYEKRGGAWKMTSVTSTFEPPASPAAESRRPPPQNPLQAPPVQQR